MVSKLSTFKILVIKSTNERAFNPDFLFRFQAGSHRLKPTANNDRFFSTEFEENDFLEDNHQHCYFMRKMGFRVAPFLSKQFSFRKKYLASPALSKSESYKKFVVSKQQRRRSFAHMQSKCKNSWNF